LREEALWRQQSDRTTVKAVLARAERTQSKLIGRDHDTRRQHIGLVDGKVQYWKRQGKAAMENQDAAIGRPGSAWYVPLRAQRSSSVDGHPKYQAGSPCGADGIGHCHARALSIVIGRQQQDRGSVKSGLSGTHLALFACSSPKEHNFGRPEIRIERPGARRDHGIAPPCRPPSSSPAAAPAPRYGPRESGPRKPISPSSPTHYSRHTAI
jgi:hypothetical protein